MLHLDKIKGHEKKKGGKLGPDQLCAMESNIRIQMNKRSILEGPL